MNIKLLLLLFSLFIWRSVVGQNNSDHNSINQKNEEPYTLVEHMPVPLRNVYWYFNDSVRYTPGMIQRKVTGEVVVDFVVEKNGSITQPHINKGLDIDADKEALRLVNSMGEWRSGKHKGVPVPVRTKVTIKFNPKNIVSPGPYKPIAGKDSVFHIVEQMPHPDYDLLKYFSDNLIYPKNALIDKIEGRVNLKFIIHSNGAISDVEVAQSLGHGLDEEAIRLVKSMPTLATRRTRGADCSNQIWRVNLVSKLMNIISELNTKL